MPARNNAFSKATMLLKKEEADRLEAARVKAEKAEEARVRAERAEEARVREEAAAAAAAVVDEVSAEQKTRQMAAIRGIRTELLQIIQKFVIPMEYEPETDKNLLELRYFIDNLNNGPEQLFDDEFQKLLTYGRRYVERLFEGISDAVAHNRENRVSKRLDSLYMKRFEDGGKGELYRYYYYHTFYPNSIIYEYGSMSSIWRNRQEALVTRTNRIDKRLPFFFELNSLWIVPYIYKNGKRIIEEKLELPNTYSGWHAGTKRSYPKPIDEPFFSNKFEFIPFDGGDPDVFRQDLGEFKIPFPDAPFTVEIITKLKNYCDKLAQMRKILIQSGAAPKKSWGLWTKFPENAANVKVFEEKQKAKAKARPAPVPTAVSNNALVGVSGNGQWQGQGQGPRVNNVNVRVPENRQGQGQRVNNVVVRVPENRQGQGQGQGQGQELVPAHIEPVPAHIEPVPVHIETLPPQLLGPNLVLPGEASQGGRTRKYKSRRRRATRKRFY